MRLYTCSVCGRPSPRRGRCPTHAQASRPRGNAFEPTRQRVAARDRWTCVICGRPIDPRLRKPDPMALHVDHVVERAAGGDDRDSNLRATHAACNQQRPAPAVRR